MSGKGNKEKNIRKLLTSQSVSEGGGIFLSRWGKSQREEKEEISKRQIESWFSSNDDSAMKSCLTPRVNI